MAAEHDHAGDPEEEDVEAGDEEGGGVEGGEVFGELRFAVGVCVGPAEGGEGKEAGGEPGVEDVGLLRDVGGVAVAAGCGGFAGDGDAAAGFAVPCGDAMAPPELAGDAPVVEVVHPFEIDLFVHLGREVDGGVFAFDGVDGVSGDALAAGVGCLVDGEEPLHGETRLDDDAGALREADGVGVVFDGDEEAEGFEVGDDLFACGVAVEAVVGRAGESDVRGFVEDAGLREVVALADGEVVGVVGGRDFDGSGAELGLGPVVG